MKQAESFTEAIDFARAVFYDLNARGLRFLYRSLPDTKQMIFTAASHNNDGNADLVKSLFREFEIKEDSRKERYAELVIQYV